jgi:ribosomal protein S18 acetylase RimI-like enzyme
VTTPADEPIRVWLEPGYDHGRTGAWMLDWPGCFTSGRDREVALARVHSAVVRHVEWLDGFGEPAIAPASSRVRIMEEVPAELDGTYERNATFAQDARMVLADELVILIRHIDFARADLLRLVERLDAFLEAGGSVPPEERLDGGVETGAESGRDVDAVLRHVGSAELWLASRLDRSVRYEGPPRDGDLGEYLEATHRWALDRLRALGASDTGEPRPDGKGETWTLAKVLRRMLYHARDHAEELDRRLAIAERRAERVELRRRGDVPSGELIALLRAAGLHGRAALGPDRLRRSLEGSTDHLSAWDDGRLVGFARIVSDEASNAYVSTVAVHPRWQDRGLGTRLMEVLLSGRDELKIVLEARAGASRFYERLGFEPATDAMRRPRLR